MQESALLLCADGHPFPLDGHALSQDWDEVQEFCRATYMPYRVKPLELRTVPNATMFCKQVGRVKISRFAYGTGVYLNDFDPEAGNILVLNTLQGAVHHKQGKSAATTRAGDSFVVDCSRTDYWLSAEPDHMQFNLTIPHSLMEETAQKWFGFVPNNELWTRRIKFGGNGSRWMGLLEYIARCINTSPNAADGNLLGRHFEEMICLELLQAWSNGAGVSLQDGARSAAPYYVRRAEEILTAEARNAPSIGDVATQVGVSARTLSEGFRRFRGITPRDFLIERRLEGFRADLEKSTSNQTVTSIASEWGFVNVGALAGTYRKRFGELPSQSLARGRK